ncbi:Ras guanine nucleotide exchange factor [Entamoeba marina]
MSSPTQNDLSDNSSMRMSNTIGKRRKEFIISNNKIVYATLDALVGYVCENCSDPTTREAFIYTFRCYASQNDILSKFVDLYKENENMRTTIVDNITKYMSKVMLTSDETTIQLIKQIIDAHVHIDENSTSLMSVLLQQHSYSKPYFETSNPTFSHLLFTSTDETSIHFLEIPALVFAKQITLMEYAEFVSIHVSELYEWNSSERLTKATGILQFLTNHVLRAHWYINILLKATEINRLPTLKRMIEIGIRLNDLNNWNGLMELITALESFPVYRLEYLFTQLNLNERENLKQITSICKTTNSEYQDNQPAIPGACVPFINPYLRKIVLVNKNIKPTIYSNDFILVNVEKCRLLCGCVREWISFQKYPYAFASNEYLSKWIQNELNQVECNEEKEFELSYLIYNPQSTIPKPLTTDIIVNVLLQSNPNQWSTIQPHYCDSNILVSEFMKQLKTEGVFILCPTLLAPTGIIINHTETMGDVLELTKKNIEQRIHFLVYFKNLQKLHYIILIIIKKKDIIHHFVTCVDSKQPFVHSLQIIQQLYFNNDLNNINESLEQFIIILKRDDTFKLINPFSSNCILTDDILIVFPTTLLNIPLNCIEFSNSKQQRMFMKDFESFDGHFNASFKNYLVVLQDGLLFFYSSKEIKVLSLGYYHLKLSYDKESDKSLIILVETSHEKEIVVLIPDSNNVHQIAMDWSKLISQYCLSHSYHKCVGVNVDTFEANPIPLPYSTLFNAIYTSDDLILNSKYFNLSHNIQQYTEALFFLEEGILPVDPIICSQILLLLLKFQSPPFFPLTYQSLLREAYSENSNPTEERFSLLKRAVESMTHNKKVIVVGISKLLYLWSDGKKERLNRNKELIQNAFVNGELEMDIIEDIAKIKITKSYTPQHKFKDIFDITLLNQSQLHCFETILNSISQEMVSNDLLTLTLTENQKFDILQNCILKLKDDKIWKKNILKIILLQNNQSLKENQSNYQELDISLNLISNKNTFKSYYQSLNKYDPSNFTKKFMNSTPKSNEIGCIPDQNSLLKNLLIKRKYELIYP